MSNKLNLRNLIYNTAHQLELVARMKTEYRLLYESDHPYSCIFYGEQQNDIDRTEDLDTVVPKSSTVDLGSLLSHTNEDPNYISPDFTYNFIKQWLDWVTTENKSSFVLTWFVFSMFYVSPRLRELVCENTEPALAAPFFENYSERFSVKLCGVLIAKKDRKDDKSRLRVTALTPLEIVVSERLRFDTIRASEPISPARG
jgi:hypothetical protein